MKKIKLIMLFALITTGVLNANAQSEKYEPAMQKTLLSIKAAGEDAAKMLEVSNNFERIAKAEKNQWLPYYYAALTQVFYGFAQADKIGLDPVADKAGALLAKADSLNKNNSEISCVKNMVATLHMLVNPQQRYMKMAAEMEGYLQAAVAQDPTNPRPDYLKGQTLKNTPAAFGGGCDAAMPYLEKSKNKFAAFKLESPLSPNWGLEQLTAIIESCK